MTGDWSDASRNQLDTSWWRAKRAEILDRDGHVCQWMTTVGLICGAPANEVDHIDNRAGGGLHDDANLQALCTFHHRIKSAREGAYARNRARPREKRPPEPHPGVIKP